MVIYIFLTTTRTTDSATKGKTAYLCISGVARGENLVALFSKKSPPREKKPPPNFKNPRFHRFYSLFLTFFAPFCIFMQLCRKYAKAPHHLPRGGGRLTIKGEGVPCGAGNHEMPVAPSVALSVAPSQLIVLPTNICK